MNTQRKIVTSRGRVVAHPKRFTPTSASPSSPQPIDDLPTTSNSNVKYKTILYIFYSTICRLKQR